MNLRETMAKLEVLGNETVRKQNLKNGAGDNQFGVKMGDIRVMAKEIKLNPELAKELWATGNWDARLLATLLMKPKLLSKEEVDQMVKDVPYNDDAFFSQLTDWVMTNVVKLHPKKEELRQEWMTSNHPMAARAGWSLTTERVIKSPEGLDLKALLDRIDKEMGSAPATQQWTMNYCLAEIGIHFPEYRERAVSIGEKHGLYRDYPVSKGCTSPFAPIWIAEMVGRKG